MKISQNTLKQIIREEIQYALNEAARESAQDVADRLKGMPPMMIHGALRDWDSMAEGDQWALDEFGSFYSHVPAEELQQFAKDVLAAYHGGGEAEAEPAEEELYWEPGSRESY